MILFDELNAQAKALREQWLPNPVGENDIKAACEALHEALLKLPESVRMWRTAQHVDGNITERNSESPEEVVFSNAFWWGTDVLWVADDPDCEIHSRYLSGIPDGWDRDEVRWAISDGPVGHPFPVGVDVPESVEVSLFDF